MKNGAASSVTKPSYFATLLVFLAFTLGCCILRSHLLPNTCTLTHAHFSAHFPRWTRKLLIWTRFPITGLAGDGLLRFFDGGKEPPLEDSGAEDYAGGTADKSSEATTHSLLRSLDPNIAAPGLPAVRGEQDRHLCLSQDDVGSRPTRNDPTAGRSSGHLFGHPDTAKDLDTSSRATHQEVRCSQAASADPEDDDRRHQQALGSDPLESDLWYSSEMRGLWRQKTTPASLPNWGRPLNIGHPLPNTWEGCWTPCEAGWPSTTSYFCSVLHELGGRGLVWSALQANGLREDLWSNCPGVFKQIADREDRQQSILLWSMDHFAH